jgi:tRNA nucleotidyltransferase (CCA-adding enzyme)
MKKPGRSALKALQALNDKGYQAFVVGGAVRDLLLNRNVYDYDITTNADPNAIQMVFEDYIKYEIGIKYGTVSVLIDKDKIDITPYRREDNYTDHRHPELISFSSELKEDLSRRDFTINAMCLDKDSNIIDMFKGKEDLENRLIRCIGDPDRRFEEDGLRILRAIRFMTKLNFSIENSTSISIHKNKDLLNYISEERKREELLKILSSRYAFKAITEYLDVFNTFMPFDRPERKINNFSDPLYALAYLLKDKDADLKKLKYSKSEIRLIGIFKAASKISIDDDYEFIETLSSIYQKQILTYLEEYHRRDLSNRFRKLKRYMVTIRELKISGEEIMTYGYSKDKIAKVKQKLLDLIHHKRINNTSYALNKYLKENVVE